MQMPLDPNYLEHLKERGKESHVYKSFQLTGLEVADMLGDREHKALYIKLAKQYTSMQLMSVARRISDMKGINNKGAYFMKVFFSEYGKEKKKISKKISSDGDKANRNNRRKEG